MIKRGQEYVGSVFKKLKYKENSDDSSDSDDYMDNNFNNFGGGGGIFWLKLAKAVNWYFCTIFNFYDKILRWLLHV